MQVYDTEGNPIEGVLSQEEAKVIQEAKEKELEEARNILKERDEELAKLKEKEINFHKLNAQKKDAERQVEAVRAEIDVRVDAAKKEVIQSVLQEHYIEAIESLSGGDDELKKKIEQQYLRLSDPTNNKSEIDKKLRDAWSLAQERPQTFSNAFSTSSSSVFRPQSSQKFNDDERDVLKKMAAAGGIKLTEDDLK